MTLHYQRAFDAGIMLNANGASEAYVQGINKMSLPSLERNTILIEEFNVDIDFDVPGSGKWGHITCAGNLVLGDTTGQDLLKSYWLSNTLKDDIRFYLSMASNKFFTCDLANDENSGFYVLSYKPGQADKNGVFPFESEFLLAGRGAYFLVSYTASTIALVSGSPCTITDSASGFVTAGFEAGQTIIVNDSAADDGQYIVDTVAAGTLTLSSAATMTGEAAGSAITIYGGTL